MKLNENFGRKGGCMYRITDPEIIDAINEMKNELFRKIFKSVKYTDQAKKLVARQTPSNCTIYDIIEKGLVDLKTKGLIE